MREILFRGIDAGYYPDKTVWREGNLIVCENGDCVIETGRKGYGHGGIGSKVIPETVGQYTGSDDGNTPIFEGDKVTTLLGEMVVEWDSVGWSPFYETDQDGDIYFDGPYKVIGTIHDKGGE